MVLVGIDPHSFLLFFIQFSSILTQSCPPLCDPMDCSLPGFPVLHQLPELAQTHVHQVSDAIQSSHPLLSPSPAFNLSQHQGLFKWVSSSHQVAIVLDFSFSISPSMKSQDWFPLGLLAWSPCSSRDSQESSPTHSSKVSILQCSAFFMVQLSHPYMTTRKKNNFD